MTLNSPSAKRRLLVLTTSFPRWKGDSLDGGGAFVLELSKRLLHDFDVTIIAPWTPGATWEEVMSGCHVHRHKQFFWPAGIAYGSGIVPNLKKNPLLILALPFFVLFTLIEVYRVVRSKEIEIIHSHWLVPSGFIAALFKVITGSKVKLYVTAHGSDSVGLKLPLLRQLTKWTIAQTNGVSVVSDTLRDEIAKQRIDVSRFFVKPMGIDTDLFKLDDVQQPPEKPVPTAQKIVFAGSLEEFKGVLDLVEAFAQVLKRRDASSPQMSLEIIGTGHLEDTLRKETVRLGINHLVTLSKPIGQAELAQRLSKASLFVLPSHREGFGLVALEALACGAKVLTSDLAHFKKIEQTSGMIATFKVGDTQDLASKMETLLSTPNDKRGVGRTYVCQHFGWDAVGKAYAERLGQI